MLGEAVQSVFKDICDFKGTDIDLNVPWLSYLDVRDPVALAKEFAERKPDVVLHLAALVDLEYCEKHPEEAEATNAKGTENVAKLAKEYDATMVYISTAGIFDGEQELYDDDDKPNPLNQYGASKYRGEVATARIVPKHFVFRAGWMMGGGPAKDKKFVKKIMKQLKGGAKELFVVKDKLGSPTYTVNFAENLRRVLETGEYGIYNMVSEGACSRYDVAQEILKELKLDHVKLTEVPSDYWKEEYFAARPRSEKLKNRKLTEKGLNGMKPWRENLLTYLRSYDWLSSS